MRIVIIYGFYHQHFFHIWLHRVPCAFHIVHNLLSVVSFEPYGEMHQENESNLWSVRLHSISRLIYCYDDAVKLRYCCPSCVPTTHAEVRSISITDITPFNMQ